MGFNVDDNLNAESSVKALKMALRERKLKGLSLIHHSDRGLQYCSDIYQEVLSKHKVLCSMTQNSDPYENAVAERINGILKQEFKIDKYDLELEEIGKLVKESVQTYNHKRPHISNYLLTPHEMHQQCEIKTKTYKSKKTVIQMMILLPKECIFYLLKTCIIISGSYIFGKLLLFKS